VGRTTPKKVLSRLHSSNRPYPRPFRMLRITRIRIVVRFIVRTVVAVVVVIVVVVVAVVVKLVLQRVSDRPV
jgi:hypothetical protein